MYIRWLSVYIRLINKLENKDILIHIKCELCALETNKAYSMGFPLA